MPVQKLLAKIHIAQKQLGMEDSIYRGILYRKFRVSSSKSLSDSQAMVLIQHFKNLGWIEKRKGDSAYGDSPSKGPKGLSPSSGTVPLYKKYDDQKGDAYSASPGIKRKIEAMWHDVYRGNEETKHLNQFIFNHVHVSDIRFLDKDGAYKMIEALKAMQKRRTNFEL